MTIKGCQHLGRTYAPGNVFGKGDSCNQCTCLESGDVQCTDNKCFQGKQKCYKLRHCVITFWKRDMQFYKKQINSWNESTVKGYWVHFLMISFKLKLSTFAKERTKNGYIWSSEKKALIWISIIDLIQKHINIWNDGINNAYMLTTKPG